MKKSLNIHLTVIIMIMLSMIYYRTSSAQDSLILEAKGMYLWQLWSTNGGGKNLNSIVSKLKSIGVNWLVIKMADGDSYYNSPNHSLYNWATLNYGSMDSVTAFFHSNGIKLLAFHYVYGVPHHWGNSVSETDVANSILDVRGLDGLLIDAEIEYDTLKNRVDAAQAYCDSILAHHPNAFIGLTAWARINGHSTFPWTTFLNRVEVNMPQTYWAARPTTVQNELNLMSSQFTTYTNIWVSQGDSDAAKPIMPLGQGEYFGYSNDVQQGDISSFCSLSQLTYKYPGVSLWEYNQINHSYVWDEYTEAWQITEVSDKSNDHIQYNLFQNYPNPFNPTTNIKFKIAEDEFVSLKVFDILGREVATIVNEKLKPGEYIKQWTANDFPSGVYFYSLKTENFIKTKKLLLLR